MIVANYIILLTLLACTVFFGVISGFRDKKYTTTIITYSAVAVIGFMLLIALIPAFTIFELVVTYIGLGATSGSKLLSWFYHK